MSRQNQANTLRVDSATLSDRARDLDVPDELSDAHDYFVESLDLRRDALAEVARQLPGALAEEERRESTGRIAEMMQVLLATDVLMKYRFREELIDALGEEEVAEDPPGLQALTFVEDINWVNPDFVADEIAGIRGADGTDDGRACTATGSAPWHSRGSRSRPGGSATVPLTEDAAFDVQVVNQGDSTETDVRVTVTVGSGGDALELEETIDEIAAGEAKPVSASRSARRLPPGRTCRSRCVSSRCPAKRSRTTTRPSSRSSSPAEPAGYPGAVDDLNSTQGIVALVAAGVAVVALLWVIVLSLKLRRVRAAQRTILGDGETDLAAHAASLQEAFVQLRDWVEEVAAGLETRVSQAELRMDGCHRPRVGRALRRDERAVRSAVEHRRAARLAPDAASSSRRSCTATRRAST